MAYETWKKEGCILVAARVVGLALEMLCKAEADNDMSVVGLEHCVAASFWYTQKLLQNGLWSSPGTYRVPLLPAHQRLTFYMWQRLYNWIAGLSLVVADAVVPKSRAEGEGHHDLVLKHGGPKGPFYCNGFISTELKVSSVGPKGRGFQAKWAEWKEKCMTALGRVLRVNGTRFGAAMLLLIGVCDDETLLADTPPLIVRAQLLTLDEHGTPQWGNILLDKGTVPVERDPPPPKRQRKGASWDEVRANLNGKWADINEDGVECVRVLDLYKAIDPRKVAKSPGQKIVTYEKHLGFKRGEHYFQMSYPSRGRGSEPYWLTLAAAQAVYAYEVHGRSAVVV